MHRPRFRAGLAPVAQRRADGPGRRAVARCRHPHRPLRRLSQPQVVQAADEPARQRIVRDPRLDPAQVMADPAAAPLEARAWQEALAVMAAQHIRPVTLAGYPSPAAGAAGAATAARLAGCRPAPHGLRRPRQQDAVLPYRSRKRQALRGGLAERRSGCTRRTAGHPDSRQSRADRSADRADRWARELGRLARTA